MRTPDDICVIACYYNPTKSRTRRANFFEFHRRLVAAGISVFVIEQVTGDSKSALEGLIENLHILNAGAILWQKERLLNRAAAMLPKRFKKIVWSDVDMIFGEDPRIWLTEVRHQLDNFVVIQAFSKVARLPETDVPEQEKDFVIGFAKLRATWDKPYPIPADYPKHGHTGYVWAARRDLFEDCGLYDASMSGSGDHLMAHAFCGDLDSDCLSQTFLSNNRYRDHYMIWAERAAKYTNTRLSYVEMEVEHLWHGDPKNRKYRERENQLNDLLFDPNQDLILTDDGAWDWSAKGKRFVQWAEEYFQQRKEN